jgi:hypothetical protein
MFAFVILHRLPSRNTSVFAPYVAIAESNDEAIAMLTEQIGLDGTCQVNGKPLDSATTAALVLQPGDVRAL